MDFVYLVLSASSTLLALYLYYKACSAIKLYYKNRDKRRQSRQDALDLADQHVNVFSDDIAFKNTYSVPEWKKLVTDPLTKENFIKYWKLLYRHEPKECGIELPRSFHQFFFGENVKIIFPGGDPAKGIEPKKVLVKDFINFSDSPVVSDYEDLFHVSAIIGIDLQQRFYYYLDRETLLPKWWHINQIPQAREFIRLYFFNCGQEAFLSLFKNYQGLIN